MLAHTMQSRYKTGTCSILFEMSDFRFERVKMQSNCFNLLGEESIKDTRLPYHIGSFARVLH